MLNNTQWETENAANTLIEAEKIKKDKPLMKRVSKLLKDKQNAISNIVDESPNTETQSVRKQPFQKTNRKVIKTPDRQRSTTESRRKK